MKNQILKLTLLLLITNSSAAFARSSDYDENGYVIGFAPKFMAAAAAIPAVPVPLPVMSEEPLPAAQIEVPAAVEPVQAPRPEEPKAEPADYDAATALRLALNAKRHSLGAFTGWCYSYVADAMEMTGVIRRDQWYSLGIGVNAAADFAAWANRNPGTLRSQLKLAKMETPARASDLPMGAIVVYNRGVCGFSSRSGHIEVKVAPSLLCSDGCQPAYQECFGSAAARAGINVYVPVKPAPKFESKVCRLADSSDGVCRYRCDDGSEEERQIGRPDPLDQRPAAGEADFCRQVLAIF